MTRRRSDVGLAYAPPFDSTMPGGPGPRSYVYTLRAPGDARVRYVGVTSTPRARWSLHVNEALRAEESGNHTPRSAWVARLLAEGRGPVLEIVEVVNGDRRKAHKREIEWIRRLLKVEPLFNVHNTGLPMSASLGFPRLRADRSEAAFASAGASR